MPQSQWVKHLPIKKAWNAYPNIPKLEFQPVIGNQSFAVSSLLASQFLQLPAARIGFHTLIMLRMP
jgi:hypothetical protein